MADDAVGLFGFLARDRIHIVDMMGLADPLLARLPASRPWRIGHFRRQIPDGYLESLRDPSVAIRDPGLAEYYRKLTIIIHGPVWNSHRLKTMLT